MLTLLAQTVKEAGDAVSVLERVTQGGVPLICLCVAVVCGVGFYWQLKRNIKMAQDALDTTREEANARRAEQEGLLREMLERDREAQEAQTAATAAVEGFTTALKDHARVLEGVRERVMDIERHLQ